MQDIEDNLIEKDLQNTIKVESAKKCFSCKKIFDTSFWNKVKTTFKGNKPIECISCGEIFCSDCYKNEIRYNPKNSEKKGYACNNCIDKTRADSDVLFLPVNTVKDSLEDVKVQLLELKNVAEPILNNKLIPLVNDTKDLVLSVQKTVDETKVYLPELSNKLNSILDSTSEIIKKSQEKVESIPKIVEEINKLNNNFNLMLKLLGSMIGILFLGEIIIIAKFIFS